LVSRYLFATVIAVAGPLVGCGGGDSAGGTGPDGKVHQGIGVSGTLTISPTSLTLVQGQSGTTTLSLALKGSSPGTITLGVNGLPPGITATFNPATLTGSGSSTVTLTAASNANILSGAMPYFAGLVGTDSLLLDGFLPSLNLTVKNGRPGVSIVKAGFGSGTVTSSPAGITCGTACSAQFDLGSITLTAAPAAGSAFVSWTGVCAGTALTCTFTPNDFGNVVTATFNSIAPAIALSVSPSPVVVAPGGSTTATTTITRINGFADPVTVAVNAPSGITVSANPTSVTGTTSTLTIGAAASLGAGSYPVTITGAGTGVAQQSLTFSVQVTPTSSGGPITFNYANCETNQIPIWFAVQNGTGAWTRVTPSNNAFTFTIGDKGAYAIVTQGGANFLTKVTYASAAEITAVAIGNPCGTDPPMGTKRINGTLANAGNPTLGDVATVVVGGASYTRTDPTIQTFALTNVPRGPRDLIAARIRISAVGLSRMILRRGTNFGNNANVPLLDFGIGSTESFSPPLGVVTPLNLGGDAIDVEASLVTANGPSAPYFFSNFLGPAGNSGFQGLPDSLLRPGDFHKVFIGAGPASGTTFRFAELLIHSINTTQPLPISFGPRVTGANVTSLAAAPYVRLRGQVSSQSTYNSGAEAQFEQDLRTVTLDMTTTYLGSAPATWTLDTPDLSAAGYDPNWALKPGSGARWVMTAISGTVLPFLGGTPVDGAQIFGAGAQDSSSTFAAALRGSRLRRPHP
jgi:hypothetical protein